MKLVAFGDLDFELRRSPRRRTVGISVERDGRLVLAAPPDVPLDELARVVEQRRVWIQRKLTEKEDLAQPVSRKEYVSGEGFYYLGRSYRLKIVSNDPRLPPLRLYRSRFEMREDARGEGWLHFARWYTLQSELRLPEMVASLAPRVQATPIGLWVRDLGFRWASRGRKGDLYFHWRVAMLPLSIIEHIVAHEMVHLAEPRHSAPFWKRLECIIPDYVERSRWLAEHGADYHC